jgi:hypothetical protein
VRKAHPTKTALRKAHPAKIVGCAPRTIDYAEMKTPARAGVGFSTRPQPLFRRWRNR